MKMVSALTVRKKFGSIVDEVVRGKEVIAITRANQPLVVMEPYATYQARESREARRKRLTEASRRIDEWARRNARYTQGGPEVVALIRQGRDRR